MPVLCTIKDKERTLDLVEFVSPATPET